MKNLFARVTVESKASSFVSDQRSLQIWDEKQAIIQSAIEREELGADAFDDSEEAGVVPKRPFLLLHAITIGVAMILVVFVEMLCISKVRHKKFEVGNHH